MGRIVANDAREGRPGSGSLDFCLAGQGRDKLLRGGLRPAEGGRRRPPLAGVELTAQQEGEGKALPAMGSGCGRPRGSPVLLLLPLLLPACPLRSARMFPGEDAGRGRL